MDEELWAGQWDAEAAAENYAEGELVRQSERWGWEQSERERGER